MKTEISTFTFLGKENTESQPSLETLHFFISVACEDESGG